MRPLLLETMRITDMITAVEHLPSWFPGAWFVNYIKGMSSTAYESILDLTIIQRLSRLFSMGYSNLLLISRCSWYEFSDRFGTKLLCPFRLLARRSHRLCHNNSKLLKRKARSLQRIFTI